jgi:hypothetical protein
MHLLLVVSALSVLLLPCSAQGAAQSAPPVALTYRSTTAGQISLTSEHFTAAPTGYAVNVRTDGNVTGLQTQSFELDPGLLSNSWQRRNPRERTDFLAVRAGSVIRLTGLFKGKKVDREYKIDARPWKQCFPVDLQDWAVSSEPSLTFWAINPVNLGLNLFSAVKKETGAVQVGGKLVEAIHVRVSPVGLAGALWHSDVWFRKSDGRYLRYQGVNGLPGTPLTVVELLEERPGGESEEALLPVS